MLKKTRIACLLTSLLLISGCAFGLRPAAAPQAQCQRPPAPPAWMMGPEPGQTYTQQLQQVLSE